MLCEVTDNTDKRFKPFTLSVWLEETPLVPLSSHLWCLQSERHGLLVWGWMVSFCPYMSNALGSSIELPY